MKWERKQFPPQIILHAMVFHELFITANHFKPHTLMQRHDNGRHRFVWEQRNGEKLSVRLFLSRFGVVKYFMPASMLCFRAIKLYEIGKPPNGITKSCNPFATLWIIYIRLGQCSSSSTTICSEHCRHKSPYSILALHVNYQLMLRKFLLKSWVFNRYPNNNKEK